MRRFISDITQAIAGPSFIEGVRARTFGDGAWFVVKLAGIQTAVLMAVMAYHLAPMVAEFSGRDLVGEFYPEGLVVTVEDGIVSTNVEEPYLISTGDAGEGEGSFANAFVIDTAAANPLDALVEYDTFALLTDDSILFQKDTGEIRAFSLSEIGDLTVSRESTAACLQSAMPIIYLAGAVAAVFAFGFILVFSVLYYLALSLLLAAFVWVVSLIRGMKLSYGASYVVTLYALALPVLVDAALDLFSLTSRFMLVIGIFALVMLVHAARYPKPGASRA